MQNPTFSLRDLFREFPYNLKLALPVTIGMLGHTIVQLVDNIMVGQLGTAELAAVSLGNSFVFIGMSLGIGFSTALTPLVAEADGAKDQRNVQNLLDHGVLVCVVLGLSLAAIIIAAQPLLLYMGQPQEVVDLAYPYLWWVGLSLFPLVAFQAFKQFTEGLSFTRPAMYAAVISNVLNVIFNYIFIFGALGIEGIGVEGAAIGTLLARTIMFLFLGVYIWYKSPFNTYARSFQLKKPELPLLKKIFHLGLPSALQMFFEMAFFTSAIWLSGYLGKNPQAANQIALNLSSMTYMVAVGLSVTAMIRVGNQLGKQDFQELRRVAQSIFVLMIFLASGFCLAYMLLNQYLPWIYLDANNPNVQQDAFEVVELASGLLIIAGIFQISDGLQGVILGSLRGIQDVYIPAAITFLAYGLVGFPISFYLGLYTPMGVNGIWVGLLSGLIFSSLLLFVRFEYLTRKMIQS